MAFDVAEMLKKTSAKCIGATDWRIGGGYESLLLFIYFDTRGRLWGSLETAKP